MWVLRRYSKCGCIIHHHDSSLFGNNRDCDLPSESRHQTKSEIAKGAYSLQYVLHMEPVMTLVLDLVTSSHVTSSTWAHNNTIHLDDIDSSWLASCRHYGPSRLSAPTLAYFGMRGDITVRRFDLFFFVASYLHLGFWLSCYQALHLFCFFYKTPPHFKDADFFC